MRTVKTSQVCFIGGSRRRVGDEFAFPFDGPLPEFLTLVDDGPESGNVPADEFETVTDEELRNRLSEMGIRTAPQTGRKKLLSLLAEASNKVNGSGEQGLE